LIVVLVLILFLYSCTLTITQTHLHHHYVKKCSTLIQAVNEVILRVVFVIHYELYVSISLCIYVVTSLNNFNHLFFESIVLNFKQIKQKDILSKLWNCPNIGKLEEVFGTLGSDFCSS